MSGPELIFATAALSALRAVEDGRAVEAGQETSASNAERDAAIAAQRGETNANEARRRGSARQATQRARLAPFTSQTRLRRIESAALRGVCILPGRILKLDIALEQGARLAVV